MQLEDIETTADELLDTMLSLMRQHKTGRDNLAEVVILCNSLARRGIKMIVIAGYLPISDTEVIRYIFPQISGYGRVIDPCRGCVGIGLDKKPLLRLPEGSKLVRINARRETLIRNVSVVLTGGVRVIKRLGAAIEGVFEEKIAWAYVSNEMLKTRGNKYRNYESDRLYNNVA